MRRQFLLVKNPTAGRGRQTRVRAVVDELRRRGCQVDELADAQFHQLNDARCLEGYDAVIAAGGDGTVRRVLSTSAVEMLPLGVIPNGTGNVLAHEVGLRLKPELIADVLLAGPEVSVRTGSCDAEPFLLMVGIGFDGSIVHRLSTSLKARIGKPAYIGAVLGALFNYQPEFDIAADDVTYRACWVIVSNARRYGGHFLLAPDASMLRQSFQVVLFQSPSRWVRILQLVALAAGRIDTAPRTKIVTARTIKIEGKRHALRSQADGDALAACPQTITSSGTVRLIVPDRFTR